MIRNHPVNVKISLTLCLVKGHSGMGKVIDYILIFCFDFVIVKSHRLQLCGSNQIKGRLEHV